MSTLAERLREEAEYAETHMDTPATPETVITRPGGAKSTVFSVRLSRDEYAALVEAAERAGIRPSALARDWIAEHLESGETDSLHTLAVTLQSVSRRLDRLDRLAS